MVNLSRSLKISLPEGKSSFLWGPRQVGKTHFLRQHFPQSTFFDFLMTDVALRMLKEPFRLREEILALEKKGRLVQPVILDEVQKVPVVMDEVHWLIENRGIQFILCGSSARKLKQTHANMLGGRALRVEMRPLTRSEVPDFDLLRALNQGLMPAHYLAGDARPLLRSYVEDYIRIEVMAEGLVRNLPAFARFMDAVGFAHGQLVNYTNVARDCGVSAKTVAGYYQILVDTLLGVLVEPFASASGRQIITSTPKFYFFDTGLAGFLEKRILMGPGAPGYGRAFEHFILMELLAYRSYVEQDLDIRYWRTKQGKEVDFVLNKGACAIEVKSASRVDRSDLSGIRAFCEDYHPPQARVVCGEPRARMIGDILVQPWEEFLDDLWAGKVTANAL